MRIVENEFALIFLQIIWSESNLESLHANLHSEAKKHLVWKILTEYKWSGKILTAAIHLRTLVDTPVLFRFVHVSPSLGFYCSGIVLNHLNQNSVQEILSQTITWELSIFRLKYFYLFSLPTWYIMVLFWYRFRCEIRQKQQNLLSIELCRVVIYKDWRISFQIAPYVMLSL